MTYEEVMNLTPGTHINFTHYVVDPGDQKRSTKEIKACKVMRIIPRDEIMNRDEIIQLYPDAQETDIPALSSPGYDRIVVMLSGETPVMDVIGLSPYFVLVGLQKFDVVEAPPDNTGAIFGFTNYR